ncbi:hypothetical protein [Enterococcus avium]|uniref:hypothetical protein n=1 Tax=Enterococcus avium TaxID=33945 RepID=UPI00346231B4
MSNFLIAHKDFITLIIAIGGFCLSLYNFLKDRRKITLSYSLVKNAKSNRLILTGVIANPSKTSNSIIDCLFFYNDQEVVRSRYHDGGFDMGHFHRPSIFVPLSSTQPISPGSSIAFSEVLKLEDVLSGDKLTMILKTANYKKKFNLKIKTTFS